MLRRNGPVVKSMESVLERYDWYKIEQRIALLPNLTSVMGIILLYIIYSCELYEACKSQIPLR